MKFTRFLLILLSSLLLSWFVPSLFHLISDKAGKNVFTYFSSIEKSFCTIDFDEKKDRLIRYNVKTKQEYSESEFDSILPLFYYHQLLADGRLPDSIDGKAITPGMIREKSFFYRYNAKDKNSPQIPIYILFESFPKRVNPEMPGDVFRLKKNIEFIDPQTNKVKQEKSRKFSKALERVKFQFPAKLVAGNPSLRKAYDEGYFVIDASDRIFHLKMVNGKPFVKNIRWKQKAKPVYISTIEPDDRSFYAFVFDENNKVWIISSDEYKQQQIHTPPFDPDKDKLIIMANPMYWNINILSNTGKYCMALRAEDKKIVDKYEIPRPQQSGHYLDYVLPFELQMEFSNSAYIKPAIRFGSPLVFVFHFILAILFVFFNTKKKHQETLLAAIWILVSGVYGFFPYLLLKEKNILILN